MDQGRVSVIYARALLDWSSQMNIATEVYEQSVKLLLFLSNNPEFSKLIASPVVASSTKERICLDLLQEFAPHFTKLLTLLIKKGRGNYLAKIAFQYQRLYRIKNNIVKVEIESASEMNNLTIGAIKGFLEKKLEKSVEVEHQIIPELIGGFKLTIDDKLLDKSVKGELGAFRRKLLGIN